MRHIFWVVLLFILSCALALTFSSTYGSVIIITTSHSITLSLNLFIASIILGFSLIHIGLRAMHAMSSLPGRAREWRQRQIILNCIHTITTTLFYVKSGRFVRAQRLLDASNLSLSEKADSLFDSESQRHVTLAYFASQMLLLESKHALQNYQERDRILNAVRTNKKPALSEYPEVADALYLAQAQWAIDQNDAASAQQLLDHLKPRLGRRIFTFRLRMDAAYRLGDWAKTLDIARLLAKHGGFSSSVPQDFVIGIIKKRIDATTSFESLIHLWDTLTTDEKNNLSLVIEFIKAGATFADGSQRLLIWLTPAWICFANDPAAFLQRYGEDSTLKFIEQICKVHTSTPEWLDSIENLYRLHQKNLMIQYLYACACLSCKLWGKAEQSFRRMTEHSMSHIMERLVWAQIGLLADQRGNQPEAFAAWKHMANLK